MESLNIPPTNHINVLDDDQGWVGLLDHMGNESTITNAARVSFGKLKTEFDDKDEILLKYLIENKHMTPLEHVKFTFSVHCPLYVRSQWMRHRACSYNEISRRYTEFEMEIYTPKNYRKQSDNNKQASTDELVKNNDDAFMLTKYINEECLEVYYKLLKLGVCKEQARGVLPQNMMTTFWWTVDLRNLINFLVLRDDSHAQKEIQEYAKAIKVLVEPHIPHVMKYIK